MLVIVFLVTELEPTLDALGPFRQSSGPHPWLNSHRPQNHSINPLCLNPSPNGILHVEATKLKACGRWLFNSNLSISSQESVFGENCHPELVFVANKCRLTPIAREDFISIYNTADVLGLGRRARVKPNAFALPPYSDANDLTVSTDGKKRYAENMTFVTLSRPRRPLGYYLQLCVTYRHIYLSLSVMKSFDERFTSTTKRRGHLSLRMERMVKPRSHKPYRSMIGSILHQTRGRRWDTLLIFMIISSSSSNLINLNI